MSTLAEDAATVNDQKQSAERDATAIQAGRDVIVYGGMSYNDVKSVALEVFEANFYKMAGLAQQTAGQRAEEITEEFLKKLQKEHPEGFAQANDPGFQHALYTVQKEHARTGDKDLGDLLVDLLVDRSKQKQRDILQIVLGESLNTAPKLTEGQLAALAIMFVFRHTQNHGVNNIQRLGEYFDKFIKPFANKIKENMAWYQHLEFTGCGNIGLGTLALERAIGTTYQGLFLKGFDKSEIDNQKISIGILPELFLPCLNDPAKLQVNAVNHEALQRVFDKCSINDEDKQKIKSLFDQPKMSEEELRLKCISIRPYMENVFKVWSDSPMKNFTFTSVGIAIAHANVKRMAGEFADLKIWIN